MKELKKFVEDILGKKNDFELGSPWKYSDKSMGVVVPILRGGEYTRDYVTLPEVKDKAKFEDLGGISPIKARCDEALPLFIRSGTVLEGISGQDRAVIHSMVLDPQVDVKIDVRCVHASRPTSYGGGFKYAGYAPKVVHQNLGKGQSQTWGGVKSFYAMSNFGLSPEPAVRGVQHGTRAKGNIGAMGVKRVKHDDLPNIKKAQMELDNNIQNILKEVPVLENQIGAIIVGMRGVIGVETFDSPVSWKVQYKEAIANYSDELAEKAEKSLFKFDESNVMDVITDFLHNVSNAEVEPIDKSAFLIKLRGFTGEVVTNMEHIIHLFLMKNDEEDEPKYDARPIGFTERRQPEEERLVGTAFVGSTQPKPIVFGKQQYHNLVTKGMKRGFKEITEELDRRGGQATWTELEGSTGISSATLSTRLKEGKEIGMFGTGERKKNGKKIYTLYKD